MNKKMILSLVDKVIKVDRGGPESRVGMVLKAEDDHFTLLTEEDGIIYYNSQHVKSLTYNSKNKVEFDLVIPRGFEYTQAADFKGILEKLTLQWVKINRGGPETLEGVLDVVTDDFVTIVSNEEIIRVSLFHIRNISYGVKLEKTKKEEKADSNGKKNNGEQGNKEKQGNKGEQSKKGEQGNKAEQGNKGQQENRVEAANRAAREISKAVAATQEKLKEVKNEAE
ncbi:hypothetical protein C7437_1011288 [Psychrobacillus insolitus]|uniref:Spore coat protein B n=1 Tax=Psychrobacillus insolitus TaxID=1461 RepID=A0A2W7MMR4_9BACI|nr:hypothetical protein [Psychrobacillus insolitus]PZX08165.1 hypothetical protein C7437_1011288 [Psychrobacillus insolitus]